MGRPATEYTQAVRVIRLLRYLEPGKRYRIDELAAKMGVHDRTIARDVKALMKAGEPIRRSEYVVWFVPRGIEQAPVPKPSKKVDRTSLAKVKEAWL